MMPPPGARQAPGGVPSGGVFAISEVLPLMRDASRQLDLARERWKAARDDAAQSKADAKRTRANLIVQLRVWGNEGSGGRPITTSVERQEWADADESVQTAELAADLAQSNAMNERAVLDAAEEHFRALTGMLAIERDQLKRDADGPH